MQLLGSHILVNTLSGKGQQAQHSLSQVSAKAEGPSIKLARVNQHNSLVVRSIARHQTGILLQQERHKSRPAALPAVYAHCTCASAEAIEISRASRLSSKSDKELPNCTYQRVQLAGMT